MSPEQHAELLAILVARMKREVDADIAAGKVPTTVSSFSELHDWVDANCYGLCEEGAFDALEVAFGSTRQVGQMLDASPTDLLDLINEAQDQVDAWLKCGRPTE